MAEIIYHLSPCPVCGGGNMPIPPKKYNPHGKCPDCGANPRAAITVDADEERHVRWVIEKEKLYEKLQLYVPPHVKAWIKLHGYDAFRDALSRGIDAVSNT